MTQSETNSVVLLKQIITDLNESIDNYSKQYTFPNITETIVYPGEIARLKELAEVAILTKEYDKALTYYKYINQFITNKKYRFDNQILLLKKILLYIKNNCSNIILKLEEQEKDAIGSSDEETYSVLKKYEIGLTKPSINDLCKEVNRHIENHLYIASASILDIIEDKDVLHKYTHITEYLKAKNNEYRFKQSMSNELEEITTALLNEVSAYCHENDYDRAEMLAKQGLLKTNHPEFCYYLGKIYYKKKEEDKSLEYFLRYRKVGAKKYHKGQLYIYNIYKRKNKPQLAMEEIKNVLEIELLTKDFEFKLFEYIASYKFVQKINKSDYDDFKPGTQKIYMTEKDFLKRNQ